MKTFRQMRLEMARRLLAGMPFVVRRKGRHGDDPLLWLRMVSDLLRDVIKAGSSCNGGEDEAAYADCANRIIAILEAMTPPPPPPAHYNCRCVIPPALDRFEGPTITPGELISGDPIHDPIWQRPAEPPIFYGQSCPPTKQHPPEPTP